jgi:hypothetical protein
LKVTSTTPWRASAVPSNVGEFAAPTAKPPP